MSQPGATVNPHIYIAGSRSSGVDVGETVGKRRELTGMGEEPEYDLVKTHPSNGTVVHGCRCDTWKARAG